MQKHEVLGQARILLEQGLRETFCSYIYSKVGVDLDLITWKRIEDNIFMADKPIKFSDQEKEYLLQTLDEAYKSYKRREGLATMDDLKAVFRNAAEKTEALRHRIAKDA